MLGGQLGLGRWGGLWVGDLNLGVIRTEVDEVTERMEKRKGQVLPNPMER